MDPLLTCLVIHSKNNLWEWITFTKRVPCASLSAKPFVNSIPFNPVLISPFRDLEVIFRFRMVLEQ